MINIENVIKEIVTNLWEKDEQKRYKTEVLGMSFEFISNRTFNSSPFSRSR